MKLTPPNATHWTKLLKRSLFVRCRVDDVPKLQIGEVAPTHEERSTAGSCGCGCRAAGGCRTAEFVPVRIEITTRSMSGNMLSMRSPVDLPRKQVVDVFVFA